MALLQHGRIFWSSGRSYSIRSRGRSTGSGLRPRLRGAGCLAQVHANERGVVAGHDPSSVHQMRVGLRRLRSARDLFAPVIPAFPGLDDELRWIASELGAARDWEVLARSTLERAAASGHPDELRPVRDLCERPLTKGPARPLCS